MCHLCIYLGIDKISGPNAHQDAILQGWLCIRVRI